MSAFIYIVGRAIIYLIDIIEFLILANVVLSWLPLGMENRLVRLIVALTEPILAPCRALLNKFEFTRNIPLDFSPILAWLFLMIIGSIVSYTMLFLG